jgi:uncharacterized membrane protein YgcG
VSGGQFLHPDDEERLSVEMGRELGAIAGDSAIVAPVGFSDRVMIAIAREPLPQPARAFGVALLAGHVRVAIAALGDAWRVAIGGSTPLGIRGQSLALVLVVGIGSLAVAGGAAVGAVDLLAQNPAVAPSPSTPLLSQPPPSAMPSPSPDPSPSPSSSPESTPDASPTAEHPGAAETPRATLRPRTPSPTATGTDDHGGSGSGSGGSGSGSGSGGGVQTPEPSPTESDDHGGSDG